MDKKSDTNEKLKYLSDRFTKEMHNRGYSSFFMDDKWMPRVIADKDNHYRVTAISFRDPTSPGFTVEGTVGLDISSVFYFQIKGPFENLDERFDKMLTAMEPFLQKELDQSSVKMEF